MLPAVKTGGRVVLVGLTGSKNVTISIDSLVLEEVSVVGSISSMRSHWQAAVKLMEAGKIQTIVSHRCAITTYKLSFL